MPDPATLLQLAGTMRLCAWCDRPVTQINGRPADPLTGEPHRCVPDFIPPVPEAA